MATVCIGKIKSSVIAALQLNNVCEGTPIFLGDTNIQHMKSKHSQAYLKYGTRIPLIVNSPDYVGLNPKDNSIEYVKEFNVDNEFVKVAVRISTNGTYFARSIYVLNNNRVNNFIAKNTLKKT